MSDTYALLIVIASLFPILMFLIGVKFERRAWLESAKDGTIVYSEGKQYHVIASSKNVHIFRDNDE